MSGLVSGHAFGVACVLVGAKHVPRDSVEYAVLFYSWFRCLTGL